MNYTQITQELLKGNKIRRKCWESQHFWQLKDNQLVNSLGKQPKMNKAQLLAEDWEVVEDEIERRTFFCQDFIIEVHNDRTMTFMYKSLHNIETIRINNEKLRLLEKAISYAKSLRSEK